MKGTKRKKVRRIKTNAKRKPKVIREQKCPDCEKHTMVIRYETRRNYPHGTKSNPVYSAKKRTELCSNNKCRHFAVYTNPPLRNVDDLLS